jgi:hypothetical protein
MFVARLRFEKNTCAYRSFPCAQGDLLLSVALFNLQQTLHHRERLPLVVGKLCFL